MEGMGLIALIALFAAWKVQLKIYLKIHLELHLKKVPWFPLAKSTSRKQFGAINKLYSRHFTSNNIQEMATKMEINVFQVWWKQLFNFRLYLRLRYPPRVVSTAPRLRSFKRHFLSENVFFFSHIDHQNKVKCHVLVEMAMQIDAKMPNVLSSCSNELDLTP